MMEYKSAFLNYKMSFNCAKGDKNNNRCKYDNIQVESNYIVIILKLWERLLLKLKLLLFVLNNKKRQEAVTLLKEA